MMVKHDGYDDDDDNLLCLYSDWIIKHNWIFKIQSHVWKVIYLMVNPILESCFFILNYLSQGSLHKIGMICKINITFPQI